MNTMTLRQWAIRAGIPVPSAYRYAKNGDHKALRLPRNAELRRTPTGGYVVDLSPEITRQINQATSDDLLARIDPHGLAEWLVSHGYVLLTTEEAQRLGITRTSTRGRRRTSKHGKRKEPTEETREPED